MKALKTLIRLRNLELDRQRRQLTAMEEERAQMLAALRELDEQQQQEASLAGAVIAADATADGAANPALFAFGAYANALLQRREDLKMAIAEIDERIETQRERTAAAFREVKKFEKLLENHLRREKREADRREQAMLDEIALTGFRNKKGAGC